MNILDKENIFAWCIVPYDRKKRTPSQRAIMLKELGIGSYAYDWRSEHLIYMHNEMRAMMEYGIGIKGIWFWMDGKSGNYFDENNELILDILETEKIQTDLWIGIPDDYLTDSPNNIKFEQIAEMLDYTYKKTKRIGCNISLYNHGGWFGEPANQVGLIEELGYDDIGMIYNFHHSHHQIDNFEINLKLMISYLRAVNINGMEVEGRKIVPVGNGDKELEMIKLLLAYNYNGPIGIIGHTENEDVKEVLSRNLEGIEKIKRYLNLG